MLYKNQVDFGSKSKLADKLLAKLKKLIIICQKKLYYIEKFQKYSHNKNIEPKN